MILLEGERILLRDYRLDDLNAVHSWLSDPEVMKYLSEGTSTSIEETFVRFAKYIETQLQPKRESWPLALVLKETKAVIGHIVLWYRSQKYPGGEAGLGYFLNKQYWNNGYVTEGTQCMIDFGFGELKMHRISASCITENAASESVMKKCGLTKEGETRKVSMRWGKWMDRVGYAILQENWYAQRSKSQI